MGSWIIGLVVVDQVICFAEGKMNSALGQRFIDCTTTIVYKRLDHTAEQLEGISHVDDRDVADLMECQQLCNNPPSDYVCNSIDFCPGVAPDPNVCFMYDKVIDNDEKQIVSQNCFTTYKTCERTAAKPASNTTISPVVTATVTKKPEGESSDSRAVSNNGGGSVTMEEKATTAKVPETTTKKSFATKVRSETTTKENGAFSKAENWPLIAVLSAVARAASDH